MTTDLFTLDDMEHLARGDFTMRWSHADILALIACVRAADAWIECAPDQDHDKWKAWKEARRKLEGGS